MAERVPDAAGPAWVRWSLNYAAMRHVVEVCRVEGPGRAILFVLAYRADRHTGEACVGMTRLARESGVSYRTVARQISALIDGGHVGIVLAGSGRRATTYQVLTDPRSSVTGNVQGNGLAVSPGPVSERHSKPVVVPSGFRSSVTREPVAVSQSPSSYKEGRVKEEGFEGGAATPSPSAQDTDDSAAPRPPTRCRHRNDPATCGACSDPSPAMPPRDALAAALGQPRRVPDPEASP